MSRAACGVGEQETSYKVRKKTDSVVSVMRAYDCIFFVGIAHTLV